MLASLASGLLLSGCGNYFTSGQYDLTSSSGSANLRAGGSCASSIVPQRAPLRLLSNAEYDNIAADVFELKSRPSVDNTFTTPPAGISGFLNTGVTSDQTAPAISDLMAQKYWAGANEIALNVITNKAAIGSAYSKLASCAVGVTTVSAACYTSIVQNLVLQLWRRPVSTSAADTELTRLLAIAQGQSTFDLGFQALITSVLMSPNFLTFTLTPTGNVGAGQAFKLDGYSLAARLSFYLWQSVPDAVLLAAAAAGNLNQQPILVAQVKRMLKDPRSSRIATELTNEWLKIGGITSLGLSTTSISAATLSDLITETTMMFQDIINNDSSFLNTISANYTFLNQNLATFYGVPFAGTNPAAFYKTSLVGTNRQGVLTQAGYLIATAGAPDATHPVLRGKALAMQMGCYPISPPPATLNVTLSPTIPATDTPRQVLAIHAANPVCAACHNTLDPYGLALENFDPFGRWRSNYINIAGSPAVDPSGTLPTGESFASEADFINTLVNSANIRSCMARTLMAAGLNRAVMNSDDVCTSGQIASIALTPNSKFSDLISSIVLTQQFTQQTTETP